MSYKYNNTNIMNLMSNQVYAENITSAFLSMIKMPNMLSKKLKYLIVMPVIGYEHDIRYVFFIGIAMISSALKASGRNVHTLNLNYKKNPYHELQLYIEKNNIDVVMTGGCSGHFWNIKKIINIVKEINTNIVTIVGGHIITTDPETAMEALEFADYGVIGEGDVTVNNLANILETNGDISELKGIISKQGDSWFVHAPQEIITNLDILPFPDYEGFEYHHLFNKKPNSDYNIDNRFYDLKYIHISISRACLCKCTFCFPGCSNEYRQMSTAFVRKLINRLLTVYPEIEAVCPCDGLTFINNKQALEFSKLMMSFNIKWRCNIRAGSINKETLNTMKNSGCAYAFMGIESADDRVLNSMQKNITINQIEETLAIAKELDFHIKGRLIFGDLDEDYETMQNTINWRYKNKDEIIDFSIITAYPGTIIYNTALERGIIKDRVKFLKEGCPLVNVSRLTDDEYYVLPALINTLNNSFLVKKLYDPVVITYNDYSVSLKGICPFCQKYICFMNSKNVFNYTPKSCPACYKPVNANIIEYTNNDRLCNNINMMICDSKAAVWAITPKNYYWLFNIIPNLICDNVFLINEYDIISYNHKIKSLAGKKIYKSDFIYSENIETVISPNNSVVYSVIKKKCKIEFPHVKNIVHITELM